MVFRLNPSSGIPLYVQLMEQVKHSIETGAARAGEQLPTIRKVAEDLVMNPNTVARAYRELEHEGVIELRHGSGAYISKANFHSPATGEARIKVSRKAQAVVQTAIERLSALGLSEEEIRRLVENNLASLRETEAQEHE